MELKYFLSRINAYFIDYFFVTILVNILISIIFANQTIQMEIDNLFESFINQEVSVNYVVNEFGEIYSGLVPNMLLTLSIYILYFVIFSYYLKRRTLGCVITRQVLIKTDRTKMTLSDLTLKMLLTNGGILHLIFCLAFIVFSDSSQVALALFSISVMIYGVFIITNFIILLATKRSLVDRIIKMQPMIIVMRKS